MSGGQEVRRSKGRLDPASLRQFDTPDQLREFYKTLGTTDFLPLQIDIYRSLLRPGDSVIDGGANCGLHTLAIAEQVGSTGKVLAFEPLFPLATALKALLSRHHPHLQSVVELHIVALSDWTGQAPFYEALDPAYSGLRDRPDVQRRASRSVRVARLDDFACPGPLRLIKLDLEGGEFPAMRGASKLIEQHRPVLLFEYDSHRSPAEYGFRHHEMLDFLDGHGYRLLDIVGTDFSRRELWKEAWLWDFVALPVDFPDTERVLHAIARFVP